MKKFSLLSTLIVSLLFISCSDADDTTTASDDDDANTTITTNPVDDGPTVIDAVASDGPFQVKAGVVEFTKTDLDGNPKADKKVYTFANYGNLVKL